jgi:hypothetical protein
MSNCGCAWTIGTTLCPQCNRTADEVHAAWGRAEDGANVCAWWINFWEQTNSLIIPEGAIDTKDIWLSPGEVTLLKEDEEILNPGVKEND